MECKVRQIMSIGDGPLAANLVIGEVLLIHIADSVLDEKGAVDPRKLRTIARLGGDCFLPDFRISSRWNGHDWGLGWNGHDWGLGTQSLLALGNAQILDERYFIVRRGPANPDRENDDAEGAARQRRARYATSRSTTNLRPLAGLEKPPEPINVVLPCNSPDRPAPGKGHDAVRCGAGFRIRAPSSDQAGPEKPFMGRFIVEIKLGSQFGSGGPGKRVRMGSSSSNMRSGSQAGSGCFGGGSWRAGSRDRLGHRARWSSSQLFG